MRIGITERRLIHYQTERVNLQDKRNEDYRKLVERRNYERIQAERIQRNIRLDLDKGRNIDVEC